MRRRHPPGAALRRGHPMHVVSTMLSSFRRDPSMSAWNITGTPRKQGMAPEGRRRTTAPERRETTQGRVSPVGTRVSLVEAMGLEPTNLLTASQALYQLSYAPSGGGQR